MIKKDNTKIIIAYKISILGLVPEKLPFLIFSINKFFLSIKFYILPPYNFSIEF